MKKLLLCVLFTSAIYAQPQVFNVQQYCVDEKPFKHGNCDVKGNEYSFVFLDTEKKDVTFFFTQMKLQYQIVDTNASEADPNVTVYTLENAQGRIEMKLNKQKTRIEFHYPNNRIYLTVGTSTKS